jgi:hypothetical protein
MAARLNNVLWLVCGAIGLAAMTPVARAQSPIFAAPVIIDSFENPGGISRWNPLDPVDPIYITHAQSAIGATNGANSLLVEMEGAHGQFGEWGALNGWAVQGSYLPSDDMFAAWQTAAQNPAAWNLEFDVTTNAGSWTGAPPVSDDPFASGPSASTINVGFSYTDDFGTPGFGQVSAQNLYQVVGVNTVRVPLKSLEQAGVPIGTSSASYYQVLLGAQNRFIGEAAGGVKYYIDKVRLKPASPQVPITLFSWETADNPATTTVNEALEGWTDAGLNAPSDVSPGDAYAHRISVTPYGATQGTKALKIDTTTQDPAYVNPLNLPQSYGFRWGTSYILNDDTDPGEPVTIDPAIQAKISDLAGKLNRGDFLQFDLTISDPIGENTGFFQGGSTAGVPGFLGVEISIQDGRGSFFQAGEPHVFNGTEIQNMVLNNPDALEPYKVSIPLSSFTNVSGDVANRAAFPTLKAVPLDPTVSSFRINIALNFNNGPVVAHIDNMRILTPISLDADFNHDGKVDGADLQLIKNSWGANAGGDADLDGDTDGEDFRIWQQQQGNNGVGGTVGVGAVPEPSTVALLAAALAAGACLRRQ